MGKAYQPTQVIGHAILTTLPAGSLLPQRLLNRLKGFWINDGFHYRTLFERRLSQQVS